MKRLITGLLVLTVFLTILAGTVIGADEKTKLSWWGWFPTVEDAAVIKKGFEAKYPNVELTYTYAELDPYISKLKMEIASGSGPDLMSMQKGALLNSMKPYLLDLKSKLGPWTSQIIPSAMKEVEASSGSGQILMVPLGMSAQMYVYYNATLFEGAGVKIPKTAAQFIAACKTLKEKYPNLAPFEMGLKDQWFAVDVFNIFANMASPGLTEKADKGEVKWTSASFVKAMTVFKNLVAKGIIPKDNVGLTEYEGAIGDLLDRKACMFANGSWNVGNLSLKYGDRRRGRATDNDLMGAFILPNFAGGKPVTIGGVDVGIAVNKGTKNQDAALKMLEYMTVGDGQQYFCGNPGAGLIPAKKGMVKDMSGYPDLIAQASIKMFADTYANNLVASRDISSAEVRDQLAIELQNIANGKDVKQALADIQKVYDRQ